ncbi:hypothetical protein TNIN_214831 [Trichonephila inaurata madagascariensis]|uniref:Uncharacterized protein n=1 Tax=Trichonephila inaurata madagascariensis TaxID=2747483 RepID=A0A8X6WY48_9ARAC|nr:hypothetical protein TNIN_214831 [Trichonephila inaurata madagascariensis]
MESKNNPSPETSESEKIVPKVSSLPIVPDEENQTSSFNPLLIQTSSLTNPLDALSISTPQTLSGNWHSIPVDEDPYSVEMDRILENREDFYVTGSSLVSPDLLLQTQKVLKNLNMDIESSLKNIANSVVAMPSVIETYRKKWDDKTSGASKASSSTEPSSSHAEDPRSSCKYAQPTPQSSTGFNETELLLPDSHCDHWATLQHRCLQYREMMQDIAMHALVECGAFSEESIKKMTLLIKRFDGLRASFRDFINQCSDGTFSDALLTDRIDSTYLIILIEQNETYLARLNMGLQLGKVCAMVLKMENETRALIASFESVNMKFASTSFKI